jgi:hypothetical protein
MGHINFRSMLLLIYWAKRNIIKKNTEALLDATKEVGLRANAEET